VDDGMTLINTDLNKYDGLATVHTRKGTQKFLSVTVWADPTGAMFYQMDPTSASNLIDAAKRRRSRRGSRKCRTFVLPLNVFGCGRVGAAGTFEGNHPKTSGVPHAATRSPCRTAHDRRCRATRSRRGLRGEVQGDDSEWAEHACVIPTLASSKYQVLTERIGGRQLAQHRRGHRAEPRQVPRILRAALKRGVVGDDLDHHLS